MKEIIKSNGLIIGLYVLSLLILAYIFREDMILVQTLFTVQGILFLLALTPIFEIIMRKINHAYRPNQQDNDNIKIIFDEIYQEAKSHNSKLSDKIELFINNEMDPNAFALGTNTIVITKGAIDFFDEEELKGVLAHEFGHLSHWDTKILLLIMSSNLIFMFLAFIIRVMCFIVKFVTGSENDYRTKILGLFKMIFVAIMSFLIHAFISLSSRQSENMADDFAYTLGYGNGLINALYKIQALEAGQKLSLKEKIMSDHPETHQRINRLETII